MFTQQQTITPDKISIAGDPTAELVSELKRENQRLKFDLAIMNDQNKILKEKIDLIINESNSLSNSLTEQLDAYKEEIDRLQKKCKRLNDQYEDFVQMTARDNDEGTVLGHIRKGRVAAQRGQLRLNVAEKVVVEMIKEESCEFFGITKEQLMSKGRKHSSERQYVMYFCFRLTELSTEKIGQLFGKDHTTVLYAVGKITGFTDIGDDENDRILSVLGERIGNRLEKMGIKNKLKP